MLRCVGGALPTRQFELAWIARHAGSDAVRARAQSALDTVTHAIEASQRIMHNLRPAILEQGLVAALQWMAQRFERRTGLECGFRTSHEHLDLPAGVPLVAYRAVQEALTNVSKHAQATRVAIDLSLVRGVLSVEVSDNGRGLAAEDLSKARSFGLRGLRERADPVGDWVDVSSGATGTTVILSVPLPSYRRTGRDSQMSAADVVGVREDERHNPSAWGDL